MRPIIRPRGEAPTSSAAPAGFGCVVYLLVRYAQLLAATVALPALIVVDNGSEFVSRAVVRGPMPHGVTLRFIRPGKPVENADIESFNRKFRDECLNTSIHVVLVAPSTSPSSSPLP